jgi:hypothetical protein
VWLTQAVATDSGWGVFWLRDDPAVPLKARLYYAHLDFDGKIDVPPRWLLDVDRIAFRERYFSVAWNEGHYGLLIADHATLNYYNLSFSGELSGKRVVGPRLFVSTVYSQEADGDLKSYPGGFIGVVEGDCGGHSCSYAFRLNTEGKPVSSVYNLIDYDVTHAFYPAVAFDGAGFAIMTVKDIVITNGGVGTKYLPLSGYGLSRRYKVVSSKEYFWDEFPDLGWNGNHFGAVWTEVTQRVSSSTWQIHFATFYRDLSSHALIADRVIDVMGRKPRMFWATQIHPVGGAWLVHYPRGRENDLPEAVFLMVDSQGNVLAEMTPFALSADALGSSVHWHAEEAGRVGIARGDVRDGVTKVSFQVLEPPVCQQ